MIEAEKILEELNRERKKAIPRSTGFRIKDKNHQKTIKGRMADGYQYQDFVSVIRFKCSQWAGTTMEKYIRPSTLFAPSHFGEYLTEAESAQTEKVQEFREVMG